ncbi:hypothetical protein SNOG_11671 [Parastagonospora nodorum SN15]|uniref:Uncharacterized protein n=1 Tax=Phaeosphaeria nodorum (strain SN15 / ATCC MYA-4574 / FGSC 10173) TaxID=321614 RepID=Q0U993_PHANO|nr:hypothetical protein SNOG_11671 [Parastagonospora nodorum SN15]EAT80715.2 hypothetical protein SNOG_11671 [Parastagonospora nodorum SN15]
MDMVVVFELAAPKRGARARARSWRSQSHSTRSHVNPQFNQRRPSPAPRTAIAPRISPLLPTDTSPCLSNRSPACSADKSCSTFPLLRDLVWSPATAGGTVTTSPLSVTVTHSTRSSRTTALLLSARNKRLGPSNQDFLCSKA